MDETIEVIIKRPWQGTVLAVLQILKALAVAGILAVMMAAGFEGFKGGEMGFMVGLAGVGGLVFLLPLLIVMILMIIALFKGRKWAVVVALILSILAFFPVIFTLGIGPEAFFPVCIIWGFTLWLVIACLKNPFYAKKYTPKEISSSIKQ